MSLYNRQIKCFLSYARIVDEKIRLMLKKIRLLICCLLFTSIVSYAQDKSNQLWTDFTIAVPLKNGYSFDNDVSYRTNIGDSNKWHSINIIPKFEKVLTKHLDVMFYLASINTFQQQDYNTWEIRPAFGLRYHFNPFTKLTLRLLARLEWRNQFTTETWELNSDLRTRFRLEGTYFINGNSFADNKMFYLLSDFEIFYTVDKDLQERYSNRSLLRAGLGYKLNDLWRFEGIYTFQFSRNTIEGEFAKEQEGIIRLLFRYYFK
jgi:hypothetical protein